MKKIEANTLEGAYSKATKEFGCSIVDLDCEIVQHPSSGFMGLFSKSAIIIVAKKTRVEKVIVEKVVTIQSDTSDNTKEQTTQEESAKEESSTDKTIAKAPKNKIPENAAPETESNTNAKIEAKTESKSEAKTETKVENKTEKIVLDSFFGDSADSKESTAPVEDKISTHTPKNNVPLQESIEKELKELMSMSCFNIDTVEVDVIKETAYIFMDGDDAALLIGKEGYRYNALSYLISNWLQNKYKLFIKLEIAQFLASQQEMISSYMKPVIEHVKEQGWGRTRPLDGVLVRIALEQLREEFPGKYVAIKRTKNGDKYVLINELNKR